PRRADQKVEDDFGADPEPKPRQKHQPLRRIEDLRGGVGGERLSSAVVRIPEGEFAAEDDVAQDLALGVVDASQIADVEGLTEEENIGEGEDDQQQEEAESGELRLAQHVASIAGGAG